jgi:formylglycine-generating enzyme required for sulfatase activity
MRKALLIVSVAVFGLSFGCGGGRSAINNIEMVFVEGGTYVSGYCNRDTITVKAFRLAKYETTQGLWKAVMGSNPSHFKGDDLLPVENVSWHNAQKFIKKLNAKTGKKYRLPDIREWEYAMRGGNKSNGYGYPGSNNIDDVAWYGRRRDDSGMNLDNYDYRKVIIYDGNSGDKTHPVGTKLANELGLHDMGGNVSEWMNNISIRPGKFGGTDRIGYIGGGSYDAWADACSISWSPIYSTHPFIKWPSWGFRLAHDP